MAPDFFFWQLKKSRIHLNYLFWSLENHLMSIREIEDYKDLIFWVDLDMQPCISWLMNSVSIFYVHNLNTFSDQCIIWKLHFPKRHFFLKFCPYSLSNSVMCIYQSLIYRKINNYPDLSKHNNHMAKCLTEELYNSLCDKKTKFGVGLDECIQTGKPKHTVNSDIGLELPTV